MRLKLFPGFLALCVSVGSLLIWRDGQSPSVSQALPVPTSKVASAQGDVPYVPTPNEVVVEMLKMAGVTKDDLVYDLGSGDGRLVIMAAQQFGARAVGVEIDQKLVDQSNQNAKAAGVSDRVKFVRQDLFETDFKDATVMTLYLLTQVNLKLRPKLLSELKPGTRVVSHQFKMGAWKPDREQVLRVGSRYHLIYSWIIPAQVEGNWQLNMPADKGEQVYTMKLRQDFQEVSGTVKTSEGTVVLNKAKLTGDQFSFQIAQPVQGAMVTMQFNGRVDKDTITGNMEILGREGTSQRNWIAKRQ